MIFHDVEFFKSDISLFNLIDMLSISEAALVDSHSKLSIMSPFVYLKQSTIWHMNFLYSESACMAFFGGLDIRSIKQL